MIKDSETFQVNLMKDVAEIEGTRFDSARAITLSKMAEIKIKNYMHIFISEGKTATQESLMDKINIMGGGG